MAPWLLPALLAFVNFGLWGIAAKVAMFHIDAKSSLIYQAIGVVAVSMITLALVNFKPTVDAKGIAYSVLTGVLSGAGCLFFTIAASKGKVSSVITITALYPFVTILLAVIFLKETVQLKQAIGMVLALGAILLVSSSG